MFHPAFDGVGGAELVAAAQARALRALGFQPTVRTLLFNPAVWRPRLGAIPVEAHSTRWDEHRRYQRASLDLAGAQADWAEAAFHRFDAVIAHNFPSSAILGRSGFSGPRVWCCEEPPRWIHPVEANPMLGAEAQRGGAPSGGALSWYRRELHEPWFRGRRARARRRKVARADRAACAGLDEIWVNSEFTRDNVLRCYGRRPVEVLYPLARLARIGGSRRGLDRSTLKILAIARLEPLKNLDTLIRGFALFLQRHPGRLEIVGEGYYAPQLQAVSASLGLTPAQIRWHGFVPDDGLERLASQCDVFALVPVDEPFGMVFAEAASRGLLLVGPNHGGPREILDDGRLGQLVDPFSAEAVAEGLARVCTLSDAEADRLREAADRACRARFGAEVIAVRIAQLLARLGIRPGGATRLAPGAPLPTARSFL